jgi:hypothetical protein
MMGRKDAIANEYTKQTSGGGTNFYYVNLREMERRGIKQYKIKVGDNFIRIISPKFSQFNEDDLPFFWRQVRIHYEVGVNKRVVLCSRHTTDITGEKIMNQPCPVCDLADSIREKNPDDARLKELFPSYRYLFLIYDVTDESTEQKGLHWLDAPTTIKEEIVALSRDRRTGAVVDVSDRKEGFDIEFERQGTGRYNTEYSGFKLTQGQVPPESWYQNAPDTFEDLLSWSDYDQVAAEIGLLSNSPAQSKDVVEDPTNDSSVEEEPPAESRSRTRSEPPSVDEPVSKTEESKPTPVSESATQTRSRGETTQTRSRGGISPEVQARLDSLTKGNR